MVHAGACLSISQAFRCRQAIPSPEMKLTSKGPRTFMSRQLDYINDIVTSVRLAMTSGYSRDIEVQESKKVGPWEVLSYNIWFEAGVEGFERMRAIGKIIQEEDPDFVLLQEVTPLLLNYLKSMDFAAGFRWSKPSLHAGYFTMILVAERVGPCTFSRRRFLQSK
jgi:hypothetical protein